MSVFGFLTNRYKNKKQEAYAHIVYPFFSNLVESFLVNLKQFLSLLVRESSHHSNNADFISAQVINSTTKPVSFFVPVGNLCAWRV